MVREQDNPLSKCAWVDFQPRGGVVVCLSGPAAKSDQRLTFEPKSVDAASSINWLAMLQRISLL